MNVLITNLLYSGNSGTVMYVKELALQLKERGHEVAVFGFFIGANATALTDQGIPVWMSRL